jgi:hypothetical protein
MGCQSRTRGGARTRPPCVRSGEETEDAWTDTEGESRLPPIHWHAPVSGSEYNSVWIW